VLKYKLLIFKLTKNSPPNVKNKNASSLFRDAYEHGFSSWIKFYHVSFYWKTIYE